MSLKNVCYYRTDFGSLLAASIVFILFAFGMGTTGRAREPLLDESFEVGENAPEGWQHGPAIPGVEYVYDQAVGSDGKRSLSLQKSVDRYFPIAQWYRILDYDKSETTLELKAKVKAVKATKAIIELQFLDANDSMIAKEWMAFIGKKKESDPPANHDWKMYGGKAVVPKGTKQIMVALQVYGPGKVWFDEILIQNAGAAQERKKPGTPATAANVTGESVANSKAKPPQPEALKTASGAWTRFVLLPPSDSKPKPPAGYPLLLVLPGGDGSIEFHPFIKSIHEQAMDGKVVVAHVIAPPGVVWPTKRTQARYATTEESLVAIVEHVSTKHMIDKSQVFSLAWSSAGPAVYESLLNPDSPLSGAFIAMSVFREMDYPSLSSVKGRRVYLLHSPDDQVCPYAMAKEAESKLTSAGGIVKLIDYPGGHGWHGDVFKLIRSGTEWLTEGQ